MIFTLCFFVISFFCLSAYDIKIFNLQRDAFRCISTTQICWSNFSFFIFDPTRFKKRLCFQWKQTEKQLHPLCSANICIPCPYFPSRYRLQDVAQRSEYSHESVNRIYGLRGRQLQWHFLVEFISFEALEMSLPLKITVLQESESSESCLHDNLIITCPHGKKKFSEIFLINRDDQLLVATKFIIFNASVNVVNL